MTRQSAQATPEPEAVMVKAVAATLVCKVDSRPPERCPWCDRRLTDRHHCEFFYE